jgi:hypothetical protein
VADSHVVPDVHIRRHVTVVIDSDGGYNGAVLYVGVMIDANGTLVASNDGTVPY